MRTGSWVYIAVQHPAAKKPFVHFASAKLRREHPRGLARVHAEMTNVMSSLGMANQRQLVDTASDMLKKDAELKSMSEQLTVAQNEVQKNQQAVSLLLNTLARVKAGDPNILALLELAPDSVTEE